MQGPLIVTLGVIAAYWKLALTNQYSFLEFSDVNAVLPWLQIQVFAIRHFSLMLWDPYEWAGQSLVGQLQPGVFSPFKWLLAMGPLDRHGHIRVQNVHLWFVLLHIIAALFAYCLFRDLKCHKPAAVIGALFYGTAGFLSNTPWPQIVEAALWAPLVFLFLLRSLRGRTPFRSAALAGVALGLSWCGGHHGPSLTLSLAACALCIWAICRSLDSSSRLREAIIRTAVMLLLCGMVSAVQVLPSLEYGKRSVRWTATGVKQWNDRIPFTEHEDFGLSPSNLLNIVVPGGNGLTGDPFTGVVALSLAGLAVWNGFVRRDVLIFTALAIGALLYSMARSDFLYGVAYSLVPFVGRLREPMLALSVFHFAMAALVAIGAESLHDPQRYAPQYASLRAIKRSLLWFGVVTFGLFYLLAFLRPAVLSTIVESDPRVAMIAFVALLMAAVLHAYSRGLVRPLAAVALTGLLLLLEQGNETGTRWMHNSDKGAVYLAPFSKTQDLADFLHLQRKPFRIETDRKEKELELNFADWNGVDAVVQYTSSAPAETLRLNWWQDRMAQLYGIEYSVSRAATRPGQQEIFSGSSGFKVFRNPNAFPRAWTVHQLTIAPNEDRGAELVREGNFDLRAVAVMTDEKPPIATCAAPDTVEPAAESSPQVTVSVQMACTGMLVISDNWFPGWHATLDGNPVRIWKMDTSFRGVVVPAGHHRIVMNYRPLSVFFGLALAILGLAMATLLQLRKEADSIDLLTDSMSLSSL